MMNGLLPRGAGRDECRGIEGYDPVARSYQTLSVDCSDHVPLVNVTVEGLATVRLGGTKRARLESMVRKCKAKDEDCYRRRKGAIFGVHSTYDDTSHLLRGYESLITTISPFFLSMSYLSSTHSLLKAHWPWLNQLPIRGLHPVLPQHTKRRPHSRSTTVQMQRDTLPTAQRTTPNSSSSSQSNTHPQVARHCVFSI